MEMKVMKFEEWVTMSSPLMLLNFMILSIFLASRFGNRTKLTRLSPSKLKLTDMFQFSGLGFNNDQVEINAEKVAENWEESYNYSQSQSQRLAFRNFREAEAALDIPATTVTDDKVVETETEAEAEKERSIDEVYSQLNKAEPERELAASPSWEVPMKMVKKSESAVGRLREAEIVEARRPETAKAKYEDEDDEVDSKADVFINMFKQQLKLQKMDSLQSYTEMLDRGASR